MKTSDLENLVDAAYERIQRIGGEWWGGVWRRTWDDDTTEVELVEDFIEELRKSYEEAKR